jgi:short-subunit dehydrogenase
LTLGSKLRHEVAERAIAITELPSYVVQRAMVEKDGSKRLEASVECRPGTSEEVVAAGVIHGVGSKIVTEFFRESTPRGDSISH